MHIKSISRVADKMEVNMIHYKTGDLIRIQKTNHDVDHWLLLGVKKMSTSGEVFLRVRHTTGWVGHIMIHDIAKIEKVKDKNKYVSI